MMRSLYSGVAGLKAHQTGMDVVGNNIANVNTTGFKSFRVTYQDTLYQTSSGASQAQNNRGGTNPVQVGLGVGSASIDKMFKDGSIQNTSSNTDLCLSGDGLFIVKDGSGEYYTRNGAFEFDGEGNYVNSAGQFVMGWMGADGVVNTNAQPGIINIPAGKPMAAEATTMAKYANNLNAASPIVTKISGGEIISTTRIATADYPVTLTLSVASGDDFPATTDIPAGSTATFDMSQYTPEVKVTVEEIGGGVLVDGKYEASDDNPVKFTLSDSNVVQVTRGIFGTDSLPSVKGDINGGTVVETVETKPGKSATLTLSDGTTVTVSSGVYRTGYSVPLTTTITVYDSLGNDYTVPVMMAKKGTTGDTWSVYLENDNGDIGGTRTLYEEDEETPKIKFTMKEATLVFEKDGSYLDGIGSIDFMPMGYGEAHNGKVDIDFSSLTQYAGSNTVKGTADGYAAGNLTEVNIDSSGVITGTYTNGVIQNEAVVAVAQFNNSGGLTAKGSSLYQKSNNSGEPNIKTATDLGCTITASALEMSNVDLSQEFTTMIVTQRGFQSNSKIITVSDEMLETLIQMKR